MTTRKKNVEAPAGDLSFEKALERLEKIVEQMEAAELPLEEVLKRYEEGQQLVRFCAQKLEEAEKKVEILTRNKDGSAHLSKFQAEDETDESPGTPGVGEKEGKLL